jgi:lipopolysaccharide export system protein LptA
MKPMGMRLISFLMPFMLLALSLLSGLALAEKADQDKPLILNADSVSINEVEQKYKLQGDILLIKGSIVVTGDKGDILVDPEGYQFIEVKGDAKSLATFRQRREGLANEFMQGFGKNVNYNGKQEVLILLGDASMKRLLNMQMRDHLRGGKIEYRDDTQEYRVSPPANHPKSAPPSSRAILAPRSKVLIQ